MMARPERAIIVPRTNLILPSRQLLLDPRSHAPRRWRKHAMITPAMLGVVASRRRGGVTPVAPNAITGLKLWLDAQTGLTKSNAAQFASANSEYLSHASNTDLQTGDVDFTFAFWVLLDSLTGDRQFVSKDTNTGREYTVQYRAGTGFRGTVFMGGVDKIATASFTPTVTAWYLVCFWHDATANTVNISVNNGATNSTATGGALDAATATEFNLGRRPYPGFQEYLSGRMQNVGFWKRVLTGAERTALYNGGAGVNYSALSAGDKTSMVSWWALDEQSGSRADSHGSNTLTDNNTVTVAAGNVLAAGAPGNGDCIRKWADQSSLATDFTAGLGGATYATGIAGLGGKNEVVFNGLSTLVSAAVSDRKPLTYAFVARPAGTSGTNRTLIGAAALSAGTYINFGAGNVDQLTVNSTGIGAGVNGWGPAAYNVGLITFDGSGVATYYFNGPQESTSTNNLTPSAGTMVLGGATAALANPYTGAAVEICFYDNVLAAADRQGLIQYLGDKYGITVAP